MSRAKWGQQEKRLGTEDWRFDATGSQKQKNITTYSLSANAQRPLAGTLNAAIFNTFRRTRHQILYWLPPLLMGYAAMQWATERYVEVGQVVVARKKRFTFQEDENVEILSLQLHRLCLSDEGQNADKMLQERISQLEAWTWDWSCTGDGQRHFIDLGAWGNYRRWDSRAFEQRYFTGPQQNPKPRRLVQLIIQRLSLCIMASVVTLSIFGLCVFLLINRITSDFYLWHIDSPTSWRSKCDWKRQYRREVSA